jgi:hypothetical protein
MQRAIVSGRAKAAGAWTALALAAASATALILHASCTIYDTSLLTPGNTEPPGGGVGWWSGKTGQGGQCFTAGYPTNDGRPQPSNAAPLPPITLAIHDVELGALNKDGGADPNAWKDVGFDLDGLCTGSPTCDTEGQPTQVPCTAPTPSIAYDGNDCRDNTFGRLEYTVSLVPEIVKTYGINDDAFNCALCVGDYNILIRLTDYNGTDTDDHVRVDLYPSPGLEKILPWNCHDDSWRSHPCFTPDMAWTVWDKFLTDKHDGPDLAASTSFDDGAFVREGYLVAHLPDGIRLWFPGKNAIATPYPVYLQKGIVTAKLSRAQDQTWVATDGVIGGRIKETDLITGFRQIGLCENDQNYSLLPMFIQQNLDILSSGVNDPSMTCDAMSMAIAFNATQATAGKVAQASDPIECQYGTTPPPDGGVEGGAEGGLDAGTD